MTFPNRIRASRIVVMAFMVTATLAGAAAADVDRSYTFDAADQLLEVKEGGTTIARHTYDGDGERVTRTAGGRDIVFVRDPSGQVLAEYDNNTGALIAEYVYVNGQKVTRIAADGTTTYFHNDHLGTPRAITDASGQIVWEGETLPFGAEHSPTGSRDDHYTFTGHEYDTNLDLHYMHARYYSPEIGRFLSVDPVGGIPTISQSWNRYSYALNNPINYTDPTGRFILVDDLTVAGVVLTTAAVIAWWNGQAPGEPTSTNGQVISRDVADLTAFLGQSLRKIGSPDRYKSKDKAGRDRVREKQDRWEAKEPKPKPASDNDPPTADEIISPGPLQIPRGAGTIFRHARSAGDFPGGGDPSMGAASLLFGTVAAHEVGRMDIGPIHRNGAEPLQSRIDDREWALTPSH
jgi:RHS repeat-associated protein